jgi:ubiquinone biosynthesis protein Coq4
MAPLLKSHLVHLFNLFKMHKIFRKLRSNILVWLTHRLALPILKLVRKPEKFPYTLSELQQFPDDSMGKALANFLHSKELTLLTYYARHDIKHIVLGYDTTDEGEGCLQCFMLGNRHISFPVLATVIYCYATMPEYWIKFKVAYQRGKQCRSLENTDWFSLLPSELSCIQADLLQHKS